MLNQKEEVSFFRLKLGEEETYLQDKLGQLVDESGNLICPLCPLKKKSPKSEIDLINHWNRIHISQKVVTHGYSVLPCFNNCHTSSQQQRAHYHCICEKLVHRKNDYMRHLKNCLYNRPKEELTKPTLSYNRKATKKPLPEDAETSTCEICNKKVIKSNLTIHFKTCRPKIKKEPTSQFLPCVLVDNELGIFMVSTGIGGAYHPNHVQVSTTSDPQVLKCYNPTCSAALTACGRGGISSFACDHIISCLKAPSLPPVQRQLNTKDIESVLEEKLIKEATAPKLNDMINMAESENSPLAVWWTPGGTESNNYVYISVWTETKSYYSKFRRVIVRLNTKSCQFDCPCVTGGLRGCVHQSIAKAYICVNRPDIAVVKRTKKLSESSGEGNDAATSPHEIPINNSITQHIDYLQKYHKIPADVKEFCVDDVCNSIDSLCPSEEVCYFCEDNPKLIKMPQRATATIYDITKNKPGVKVFFKECPVCHYKYQYHEYKEGVHMSDSTTVLTLQLCLMLRSSIKHHTAVGRLCSVMEDAFSTKFPANIFATYLHFEAQTDHKYDFTCNQCGNYPTILILDANRKTCFSLTGESIKPPPADISEKVDMKQFWDRIEKFVLASPLSKRDIKNPFKTEVQYQNWSQWIAPNSIQSDNVINTEYKKLSKLREPSDENEDIDKGLSDEYIDELLCEGTVKFVKEVAREMNVDDKGSKMDVIVRLQKKTKQSSHFKKVFSKLWGRSGGFLACLCQHGICYGIKPIIRAESVRDHVDMILSFKYQPTIAINDLSNLTARHGNKRKTDMFSPHEGRVDEPTDANLDMVFNKTFNKSFPCFKNFENMPCSTSLLIPDHDQYKLHPITGSGDHLMLSDAFHKKNLSGVKDKLRDLNLIPELRGHINTQVAEQFFSEMDKNLYFTNKMKVDNHLFMLRLTAHLQNDKRNNDLMAKIEKVLPKGMDLCSTMTSDQRVRIQITKEPQFEKPVFEKPKFEEPSTQFPQHTDTVINDSAQLQQPGFRGILNVHHNCWLNSSVQSVVKILRDPANIPELSGIYLMNVMIRELSHSSRQPYDPNDNLRTLHTLGFEYDRQHDAHEFLSTLLPELQRVNVFDQVVINYVKKCLNEDCSRQFSVPEQHFMLSLPVRDTIQMSINEEFRTKLLERDGPCDFCHISNQLLCDQQLLNTPSVIAIHLLRFKTLTLPGQSGAMIQKDNSAVIIERFIQFPTIESENAVYHLTSIVCHRGELRSGHYWTVHTNVADNNSWIFLNDSDVFVTKSDKMLDLDLKTGAYVLFYEKVYDRTPVPAATKEIIEDVEVDATPETPEESKKRDGSSRKRTRAPIIQDLGSDTSEIEVPLKKSKEQNAKTLPLNGSETSPIHMDHNYHLPTTNTKDHITVFPTISAEYLSPTQSSSATSTGYEAELESRSQPSSPQGDTTLPFTPTLTEDQVTTTADRQTSKEYQDISSSTNSALSDFDKKEDLVLPTIDIQKIKSSIKDRPRRKKKKKFDSAEFELKKPLKRYCVCQKEDDGRRYVLCNGCSCWYHPSCINVSDKVCYAPFFICSQCKQSSRIQVHMGLRKFCENQPSQCVEDSGIWNFDHLNVSYITELIVTLEKYKIQRIDLKSLDDKWSEHEQLAMKELREGEEGWLSDEVVNSFISSIVKQKNLLKDKKFAHLDSFSWKTKHTTLMVTGAKVFLLPVLEKNHWTLCIVTVDRQRRANIRYYDPAGATTEKSEVIKRIKSYFTNNELKIQLTSIDKGPEQPDAKSCGVFVCLKALCEILGEKFKKPTASEINQYRKIIAATIITQGDLFFYEDSSGNTSDVVLASPDVEVKFKPVETKITAQNVTEYTLKPVNKYPTSSDESDHQEGNVLAWNDFIVNREYLKEKLLYVLSCEDWSAPELLRVNDTINAKHLKKKIDFGEGIIGNKNLILRLPNLINEMFVEERTKKGRKTKQFFNCKVCQGIINYLKGETYLMQSFVLDTLCKEAVIYLLMLKQNIDYVAANAACTKFEKYRMR